MEATSRSNLRLGESTRRRHSPSRRGALRLAALRDAGLSAAGDWSLERRQEPLWASASMPDPSHICEFGRRGWCTRAASQAEASCTRQNASAHSARMVQRKIDSRNSPMLRLQRMGCSDSMSMRLIAAAMLTTREVVMTSRASPAPRKFPASYEVLGGPRRS